MSSRGRWPGAKAKANGVADVAERGESPAENNGGIRRDFCRVFLRPCDEKHGGEDEKAERKRASGREGAEPHGSGQRRQAGEGEQSASSGQPERGQNRQPARPAAEQTRLGSVRLHQTRHCAGSR